VKTFVVILSVGIGQKIDIPGRCELKILVYSIFSKITAYLASILKFISTAVEAGQFKIQNLKNDSENLKNITFVVILKYHLNVFRFSDVMHTIKCAYNRLQNKPLSVSIRFLVRE
jgi:hypothetical protein